MADLFKFVQAQSFALAGGGAVSGATSIILKSFTGIDGALLTMSDFGSIGFGTLEPGNGILEEQISFTGVTQNANGSATLTGISNVTFISPYTATSGLSKTHAGSTTFIISNTSGFYDRLTGKADDETITGLWDFPSGANNPTIGAGVYVAPTLDTQIATKKYVDSVAVSGAPDANTTTKGIVQIATQAQVDAKTATGSTAASLVPTPALARSTLLSDNVADTGTATAYAIAPAPVISAYAVGQRFTFKVKTTNTASATLAVNGLAGTLIVKNNGTPIGPGDLILGQIVEVVYNGTSGFQLMTPVVETIPSGTLQAFAGSVIPSGWLLCTGATGAISRTTYSALFAAIGTAYGAGNGSTTFNIPNFETRVPVGRGNSPFNSLGNTGGEETHVLTIAELAAHTHTFTSGVPGAGPTTGTTGQGAGTTTPTSSVGSDTAHNNLQPYIVVNYIIKT